MKGIVWFKDFIKKFITVFASREFAFIYCLVGTIGQISHCYYLVYSISSFTGVFRSLQAVLLAVFISSSLMYFVSIADSDDGEKEYKRVRNAISLFMYIEIIMNMYYYCQHLIILSSEPRIFDFIFSTLIAVLIPVTIKLYSNSIRAKAWIKEIESRIQPNEHTAPDTLKKDEIKNIITSEFSNMKNANEDYINNMIDAKLKQYGRSDGTSIDDLILKRDIEKIIEDKLNNTNK